MKKIIHTDLRLYINFRPCKQSRHCNRYHDITYFKGRQSFLMIRFMNKILNHALMAFIFYCFIGMLIRTKLTLLSVGCVINHSSLLFMFLM